MRSMGISLVGMKWVKQFIFVCLCCGILSASAWAKHEQKISGGDWVSTWASSPQLGDAKNAPPEPGFHDSTIRQVVHVSIGGKQIRVRFSNEFGTAPLTIASAHIAVSAGHGAIRAESDKALAFHGMPSVTIPAGALIISDPLDFDLAPLSDLAISMHMNDPPDSVTTHPGSRQNSYFQAGNSVSAADISSAPHVDHWYFINGVDVVAKNSNAVVTLGDSITDGRGSTTDGNDRWPDDLARRLQSDKHTTNVAVLNHGIGGNRLLHDGLGPNALARFDRDVLSQTGVRWLIVFEGINDIGTRAMATQRHEQPASAEDMVAAYQQIIDRAHSHHIRVYGATMTAFGGSFYDKPDTQEVWAKVNNWIRTSGKFDAVIDFDAATHDPQNPSHLLAADDSGDHLHLNSPGYKSMAGAIDLKLFQ